MPTDDKLDALHVAFADIRMHVSLVPTWRPSTWPRANGNDKLDAILSRIPLKDGERARVIGNYHDETIEALRDLGPLSRAQVLTALNTSVAGEVTPMGMVERFALLEQWAKKKNEPRTFAAAHQAVLIRARMYGIAARGEDEPPQPRRFQRQLAQARRELESYAASVLG